MIRILYDARKISSQATGVGYVVKKILQELLKYKDLEVVAFTKKDVNKVFNESFSYPNLIIHETGDDSDYFGLKRVLFEQIGIPKLIQKYKPDILHLTNGFGVPVFLNKKKLKIVLTIHDLIPLTQYKELMSPLNNHIFKALFSYGINKAGAIVAVSKFTADDVKKFFPKSKNIYVVYNGIDRFKKVKNSDEIWTNLKKKFDINQAFILYIGGFAPRKNILRVLQSYNDLIKNNKYRYQLLLCGKFTKNKDILAQINKINQYISIKNLQNQVRLIGYLNLDEKYVLLSKAKFFVYLSLYEGFGLPVLEALSVGTPTLTSKNSVMEEVAQKYSCYAIPNDNDDILSNMTKIVEDYEYYKKLAKEAKENLLLNYNWTSSMIKCNYL